MTKLQPNKRYLVALKYVVRGEPYTEMVTLRVGVFIRETKRMLHFVGFSVRKASVLSVQEQYKENEDIVAYVESLLK